MYLPAPLPFLNSPTQEINLFSLPLLCAPLFLYFMRPQPELNLDCWVTERLTVKGREREQREKGEMKEKELGRWWALPQLQPAEPFQMAHNCSAATEALLSIRIFPFSSPSLNDKRGEQAWAGIIGSFLSASAMCEDSNNGRDREGKWFKVRFSPAPFSQGSAPFRAC